MSRSLMIWFLLGIAWPAPAEARAPDPEDLLRRGVALFDAGKFKAAIKVLVRAELANPSKHDLGQARLYQGLCLVVIGKSKAARRRFESALLADPDLSLDRQRFNGRIVELFEDVKGSLRGWVQVEADQAGARVSVNGRFEGEAPLALESRIGSQRLLVRGPDGRVVHRAMVVVTPGETASVTITLSPPGGAGSGRLWTWVAAGGAAASLGVGIGLWAWADADHDEFLTTPDPARYDELKEQIRQRDSAAVAMFCLAGGLAAASAVLYFVEGRRAVEERNTGSRWVPRVSAAGLAWDLP